jgi:hypothetical protein
MVMGLDRSKAFLEKSKELEAYFIGDDHNGGFIIYYTPGFERLLKKN